jgi:hypothetical protein
MAWPPQLAELKSDMGITDTRDDAQLTVCLDAAIAYVERVRVESFNFDADPESELPDPTADLELGTLRLAGRWFSRRKSPEALIEMGEFGSARVPSFDADIERLLGIGRYRRAVFA